MLMWGQGMEKQKITIEYLYFHYINTKETFEQLKSGGTHLLQDEKVIDIYLDYFTEVVNKPTLTKSYTLMEDQTQRTKDMKTTFESLRRTVFPEDIDLFNEKGTWLAKILSEEMKGYHPGVLFVGRFENRGKRYIGLLKLEWVDQSYVEYDEDDAELTLETLAEKLPAAGKLQKGGVYPSPIDSSYMKIYQKDHTAAYFNDFLGGIPPLSAKEVMSAIRKIALPLVGGQLTIEQSTDIHDAMSDFLGQTQRIIDKEAVTEIIKQSLSDIPRPRIKEAVERSYDLRGPVNATDVENLCLRFFVGDIKVSGSFRSIAERFVENGHRNLEHVIKGDISEIHLER